MLDVHSLEPTVVACHAEADRCDAVERAFPGAVRVAADEVLVIDVAGAGSAADLLARATGDAGVEAVVLDVSAGWSGIRLVGPLARDAFEHLSRLELPDEGVVLGDVVRAPAIVSAAADEVAILVPASWGAHLRARVGERCRHLLASEPRP